MSAIKIMTLENLIYYNKKLMNYIDETIKEHNKVVIMKECPNCGAHKFVVGDHKYTCSYCGSEFNYTTFYDEQKMDKLNKSLDDAPSIDYDNYLESIC